MLGVDPGSALVLQVLASNLTVMDADGASVARCALGLMAMERLATPGLARHPAEIHRKQQLFRELFGRRGWVGVGEEHSDPAVWYGSDLINRDQLSETGFEAEAQQRLERLQSIGCRIVRLGDGYSHVERKPGVYDFGRIRRLLDLCDSLGIEVIINLLQFGINPSLHAQNPGQPYFQNPDFPEYFARYAAAFARQFPRIRYFSLVNEPYITALFSAFDGRWNEGCLDSRFKGHRPFARAIVNIARAAIHSRRAIESVFSQRQAVRENSPVFFQNDSFEYVFCDAPDEGSHRRAWHENTMGLMGLDLIFGHRDENTIRYLAENGIPQDEIEWCLANGTTDRTVLGVDHYPTCIKQSMKDGIVLGDSSMPLALGEIIAQRWLRYCGAPGSHIMPILLMEVNGTGDAGPEILERYAEALQHLLTQGFPVLGLLWHPGTGHLTDWNPGNLLTRIEGTVCRCGLWFQGHPEPALATFRTLLRDGFTLPTWMNKPRLG